MPIIIHCADCRRPMEISRRDSFIQCKCGMINRRDIFDHRDRLVVRWSEPHFLPKNKRGDRSRPHVRR